jgi:hypothetical protein
MQLYPLFHCFQGNKRKEFPLTFLGSHFVNLEYKHRKKSFNPLWSTPFSAHQEKQIDG